MTSRRINGRMQPLTGQEVAGEWENWCGETPWSRAMREFGELGGTSVWWCGYPRSCSAIPLTFTLIAPTGEELYCDYRLKDIKAAVATLAKAEIA